MKKVNINKKFFSIYYGLFAAGLFLSFWYAHHQVLKGDQFQMLQKGYIGAYTGYWINFGSSASASGNVPGTLSSLIVGLPLLVVDNPWAPMTFLIILHCASFFLLDSVIKKTFQNYNIRLVFLVLYWLNPWVLFENKLYNISYLLFCSALHIWSAFKMRDEKSFWHTVLHLMAIGMAMQLHHSWVVLAIISFYLFCKKLIKVNWSGFVFGCLIISASLIPYSLELLKNESIRNNDGVKSAERYIGWGGLHVYPVFKALTYWLRYGSFYFPKPLFSEANFDWAISSATYQQYISCLYKLIVYSVSVFTIWVSWISNRFTYKKIKRLAVKKIQTKISDVEWIALYTAGAVIAVFVSAVLSPIVYVYWHLMIVFPFAIFPFLILVDTDYSKYFGRFFIPILTYVLAVNFITSIDCSRFDLKSDYMKQATEFVDSNHVLKNKEDMKEFFKDKILFDPW